MTRKEYVGKGSISSVREAVGEFGAREIFLVTGGKSYSQSGAKARLENILCDCRVRRFCEFEVNPKLEDVRRGIDLFCKGEYDVVIAVGGGSVIDVAKAINFLAVHPMELGGQRIGASAAGKAIRPLIAIPTTSGSGSEATRFAVIYVDGRKQSITDKALLPQIAIIDPDLTMSLPKDVTAVSGLDALSQAIESYWSAHSTDESKLYASEAIKLILGNLDKAVNSPTADSRLGMAKAAHIAGKAINITKTTAAHSISYPLTSYFGIPHGQAVAVVLPALLVFNSKVNEQDVTDGRGVEYVRQVIKDICGLLGVGGASEAMKKLQGLITKIGGQTRLSRLSLNCDEDIDAVVTNAFEPERMANNPRRITREDLRKMLRDIY